MINQISKFKSIQLGEVLLTRFNAVSQNEHFLHNHHNGLLPSAKPTVSLFYETELQSFTCLHIGESAVLLSTNIQACNRFWHCQRAAFSRIRKSDAEKFIVGGV